MKIKTEEKIIDRNMLDQSLKRIFAINEAKDYDGFDTANALYSLWEREYKHLSIYDLFNSYIKNNFKVDALKGTSEFATNMKIIMVISRLFALISSVSKTDWIYGTAVVAKVLEIPANEAVHFLKNNCKYPDLVLKRGSAFTIANMVGWPLSVATSFN